MAADEVQYTDVEAARIDEDLTEISMYLSGEDEHGNALGRLTPAPWWWDEDDDCVRLHGTETLMTGAETVDGRPVTTNLQILKAPKHGTPYMEYWPGKADQQFIEKARTDLPRLFHAVRALQYLLERHKIHTMTVEEDGKEITKNIYDAIPGDQVYAIIRMALLGGKPIE